MRPFWNKIREYPSLFSNHHHVIVADLEACRLTLFQPTSLGFSALCIMPFSHSKAPFCNLENSLGTPLGLHYICEKIGDNVPVQGEFVGRKFTGRCIPIATSIDEKPRITTRILRLQGCEWGKNKGLDLTTHRVCDTYKRYVYIHGTNLEIFIPQPLSNGCLLLKTTDLLTLFEQVNVGDFVLLF